MPRRNNRSFNVEEEHDYQELERRMEKFSMEKYNCGSSSPEEYLEQFKRICRVKGMGGSDERTKEAKKDLLLAYVGSEPLQKLNNYFAPKPLDSCTWEKVEEAFISLFGSKQTLFSARCEYERTVRREGETVTDFYTRLKKQSKDCDYGSGLDERIRDRFVAGVRHEQLELEVRHRWPDGLETDGGRVTAERVFQLAKTMEIAQKEVCSQSVGVYPMGKRTTSSTNEMMCFKCGYPYNKGHKCPARDKVCKKCNKIGHFARVCKKVVKKVDANEGVETMENSESSLEEDWRMNSINELKNLNPRAVIEVTIDNLPCTMEFDSGAGVSTISQSLWVKLGRPELHRLTGLTGYGKKPLECLGKCWVLVGLRNKCKRLEVAVMNVEDTPLFGLPWMVAFGLRLPAEVSVNVVRDSTSSGTNIPVTHEVPKAVLLEFQSVFDDNLGTIRGVQARIRVRENVSPIAIKARRVPFPLRKPVENELNRLVEIGVVEKINPADTPILWSTPTVNINKGNGKIRICGDFKVTLNNAIIPEVHQMPTFADLTSKIAGGKYFTVIDLRDAYLQMEVAPEDRNYLIIATHLGFFRYKRLAFGLTDAPAKFQRFMEELLGDIPGVGVNLDDIIISGKTVVDHQEQVRAVLKRLQAAGIKAKKEKCQFFRNNVVYLGHEINETGIHPTGDKVAALRNAKTPSNKRELRAFLGVLNFYEKFIPHLHGLCSPLHKLTSSKVQWVWTKVEQEAFEMAKDLLAEDATVLPYREDLPTTIACDASESGLAAVLLQTYPDGIEKPIAFASRTLQNAEKHYSSIDREALACVYGVVKFHQYVFGRLFTLTSDHRPLERIFGPKRDLTKMTNNRLVRWALFLNSYQFNIQYKEGKENFLADAFSRLPSKDSQEVSNVERSVKLLVTEKVEDMALVTKDLQRETKSDDVIKQVMLFLESSWPAKLPDGFKNLTPYFNRRSELSSVKGILMWGNRIVIPNNLQRNILRVLHQGHPGIASMRTLSRYYVWWPKIDEDVERFVKNCNGCQENRPKVSEVPLYSWNVPDGPWERLHLDYAGPFQGYYWLVGVDAFSKWPEVCMVKSITAESTINKLREWFSRWGIPKMIVTDNGTQFTADVFQQFCKWNNIKHVRSSPYHPKTNGLAERFIGTFKRKYLSSKDESGDPAKKLYRLLFSYRNTPHKTTDKPPAELFLGRRLPNLLDRLKPTTKDVIEEAVWKQKVYHDRSSKPREFLEGEDVWVQKEDKKGWMPGTVQRRTGALSYEVKVGGVMRKKHADHLRRRTGALEEEDYSKRGEV